MQGEHQCPLFLVVIKSYWPYDQAYLKSMAHWSEVLPDFILTVKDENIVDDLE